MSSSGGLDMLEDLPTLVRKAWAVGRTIDLTGIGYGRIHWGNQTDVVASPFAYYNFLAGLVRITGARRILEIGTHSGGSIRAMKEGLLTHDGAVLVTVDVTSESDPFLRDEPLVTKIQGDANSEGVLRRVVDHFGSERCDLLYVDATHDFWPTMQNVAVYVLAVRPRLVVMDDITLNPAMARLWEIIRGSAPGRAVNAAEVEPAIRPPRTTGPGFGVFQPGEVAPPPSEAVVRPEAVAEPNLESRTVLVLGMPRSGTSAVAATLKRIGDYGGFDEGHFLAVLKDISEAILGYYRKHEHVRAFDRFLINQISAEEVMRCCARAIRDMVNSAHHSSSWLDKTPGGWMVDAVPVLASALPDARFVFVKRRALETVRSARRKFAQVPFEDLCRWWAHLHRRWLEVRPTVSSRCVEVEHRDMVEDPLKVAGDLGRLLEFSPLQVELVARDLRTQFPEKTPDLDYAPVSLETIGWTPDEVTKFKEICGSMMDELGYGYGVSYYA